jgi:hypothetical protein
MITGCNGINAASMAYYAERFPNALVFGSGMGVDPESKAGPLIEKFWGWIGKQGLSRLDWKHNPAHRKLLARKFEQYVELVAGNDPGEVAGMGWFDTRTGCRRVYMKDTRTGRGRWVTQDFTKLLPKTSSE